MTTAQIAERIIRRHQGEVLTLCVEYGFKIHVLTDTFKVPEGCLYAFGKKHDVELGKVREVFPGPLTRQQIQRFYEEHGVPQEARYA